MMASDGDQLTLSGYHFADWQQGDGVYADIYYKTRYTYVQAGQLVEDWKGDVRDVDITVNEALMAIENVITFKLVDKTKDDFLTLPVLSNTSGSSSISYSEYADTGFTRTVAFPTTAGKWETTIKDLLKKDAEGNLYRYYITEDSCSPMAESVEFVDQDNNDIRDEEKQKPTTDPLPDTSRSVVVTNTYETTDFVFSKEWHDIGDNVDPDWHGDIRVFVQRKIGNGALEAVGKYTIHKENTAFVISKDDTTPDAPDLVNVSGFTFKISDLPKKGITGDVTGEYVYFVTEETVSGYRDAEYRNPSVSSTEVETTWITSSDYALNNGKIINRPENSVELPHTGGPGTTLIHLLGIMLTGLAGVCLVLIQRQKKEA